MFYYLNTSYEPISNEEVIRSGERKKRSARGKITTIAHAAMTSFADNLKLTREEVFGSDEIYRHYLKETVMNIDYLNDQNNNIICKLFESPILFNNQPKFLNIKDQTIVRTIVVRMLKVLNNRKEPISFPLNESQINAILAPLYIEQQYLFDELKEALLIKTKETTFVKEHFYSQTNELSL